MKSAGFIFLAVLVLVAIPALILINVRQSNGLPGPSVAECPPEDPDLPGALAIATSTLLASPMASTPTPTMALPTGTPGPAPTRTPLPAVGDMTELQAEMKAAVDRYGIAGRYAVAVTDLQTGETASVNADRPHLSACAINFFVLLQVTIDLQAGRYAVETVDALMSATTWSSNASTARDLYGIVGDGDVVAGVQRVADLMRGSLGLTASSLNHPPLYVGEAIGPAEDNLLTANEANRALALVWNGDILEPAWKDYLLQKLATVKPGLNYLLAIASGDVSHKNGFFEDSRGFVDNDIGIVRLRTPDGEVAFAMSFFSEGVQVKYADVTLGQQLVRLATAHFQASHQ